MKKEVNTHEAKTHLSRLLKRVALGEEITVASRGKPVARLIPIRPKEPRRQLGMFATSLWFPMISMRYCQPISWTLLKDERSAAGRRREIPAGHQRDPLECGRRT
jgi:prevent-host-death family protein